MARLNVANVSLQSIYLVKINFHALLNYGLGFWAQASVYIKNYVMHKIAVGVQDSQNKKLSSTISNLHLIPYLLVLCTFGLDLVN